MDMQPTINDSRIYEQNPTDADTVNEMEMEVNKPQQKVA